MKFVFEKSESAFLLFFEMAGLKKWLLELVWGVWGRFVELGLPIFGF